MIKVKVTFKSGRIDTVENDQYEDVDDMVRDMTISAFWLHSGGAVNMLEVETIKPIGGVAPGIRRLSP